MEKRLIAGPDSAAKWQAEECTLESSTLHSRDGKPLLHWHITVDYLHGEPKYLIGWPRINLAIKDRQLRDWSGWEYLQMWIYSDTSRDALPISEPAGLGIHGPTRALATHQILSELVKGKWVQIRIPLSRVAELDDIRSLQFNISESKYRHLDEVDFFIDDLALIRYAQPTIVQLSSASQVCYADARYLAGQFELRGVRAGQREKVTCQLLHNKQLVAACTTAAAPGMNHFAFDLATVKLQEGEYELQARAAGFPPAMAPTILLVKSPWQLTK